MTKGANMFKVAPSLVAAIFTEENFTHIEPSALPARWQRFVKDHPDPNSGWGTNQFKTMGAFQFIPDTWKAYGVDANGDGVKNAQNFGDGAAGAANYLAANGGTADKPPASWQNAIFRYNHAQWYVDAVLKYYTYYASGGSNSNTSITLPTAQTGDTSLTPSNNNCAEAVGNITCTPGTGTAATSVRAKVVCIAQAEYALWKAGNLKPGTDFHKYSQGRNEDWCADFASWVYNQAGYPLVDKNQGTVPAVNGIWSIGTAGNAVTGKFRFHSSGGYTPQPGDMAIHKGGPSDVSHVNIVSRLEGSEAWYIGGNQGRGPFTNSSVTEYKSGFAGTVKDPIVGYVTPNSNEGTQL
jgi:hypothetical protein